MLDYTDKEMRTGCIIFIVLLFLGCFVIWAFPTVGAYLSYFVDVWNRN